MRRRHAWLGTAAFLSLAICPVGRSDAQEPRKDMDGASLHVKVEDMANRTDEIHDKVRQAWVKLKMIEESLDPATAGDARADIVLKNAMSSAFVLKGLRVFLDDKLTLSRDDVSDPLAEMPEFPVYAGRMAPGDHVLRVVLDYQGNGSVLTYLRGYSFQVKSSHVFTAVGGKQLSVTATAFEKGDVTTPFELRPAVQWDERMRGAVTSGTVTSGTDARQLVR